MKRSRWVALVAVLVVSVGTLAATAVTAGAQSSSGDDAEGDRRRHHRRPRSTSRWSPTSTTRSCPTCSRARSTRSKGAADYLNSKAGGGGLAGRKVVVDFYDSKLNPNETTNAEIQACENDVADGRHLGGVPGVGRRHAQLQGLDRCGDGPARHPVRVDRAGAAVLRPVVPDGAAAGDLLDRDRAPADLPAQRRAGVLLQQEVRQGPPRRLRLRQRLEVGP